MSTDYLLYSPELDMADGWFNSNNNTDFQSIERFLHYCRRRNIHKLELISEYDDRFDEKNVGPGSFNANDERLPLKAAYLADTLKYCCAKDIARDWLEEFETALNMVLIRDEILAQVVFNLNRDITIDADGVISIDKDFRFGRRNEPTI